MAKETKVSDTLTGWFDVKVYNERIARENWKLKGEDDQIAFTVTFAAGDTAAVPFAAHGKPYTDNGGNNRVRVTFKIGGRCRWYDENAQPVEKPTNAELDGKRYEVSIQYNELAVDPAKQKAPRGYWVNAIQFPEAETNPFAAMGTATVGFAAPTQPVSAEMPPVFDTPDSEALPY
jgi:hypothetical protein